MQTLQKPEWLKITLPSGEKYEDVRRLKQTMRTRSLHTVCEEAKCPNLYECWASRTATFMILGNTCTRACRFCAVNSGLPTELDLQEPERVADAAEEMGLFHVVITSVARDDLKDGGASLFAATIRAIRKRLPLCSVEVLIPDFQGNWDALETVLSAKPQILNHNVETVERLSDRVRSKATYRRSLQLLEKSKQINPNIPTKSSIMIGVGETKEEILQTMRDLRAVDVNILTIGQYLQPTKKHLKVEKYWHPDEFEFFKREGIALGFEHVESGPLVRSSYRAHEQGRLAGHV